MEKALNRHLVDGPGSRESPARVISVRVTGCSSEERIQKAYQLDALDYIFIAISLSLVGVVGLATLLDVLGFLDKDEETAGVQVLQCFSSKRNLNALAKKDPAFDGIRVEYLSGMRFLTVTFLVAVHRVLHTYRGPVHNYLYVADVSTARNFQGCNRELSRALVPTSPARIWLSKIHGGLRRIYEFSAVME